MYTHYAVAVMDRGGLARGMYTRSGAYETPALARELGPSDPHMHREHTVYGANGPERVDRPLALVRVETTDDGENRRLLREVILEVLP